MAKGAQSSKEEYLQIAILAGFFTAGGFLLVTLALVFYLTPAKVKEAQLRANNYDKLAVFLEERELHILRQTAKDSEGTENDRGLREIISETMNSYALQFSDFPAAANKQGAVTQKLTLQPATMSDIFKFVAAVKGEKKTINVLSFNLRPATRGKRDDESDSWVVTVEFRDQVGATG